MLEIGALERAVRDPNRANLRRIAGMEDHYRLQVGDWRVLLGVDRDKRTAVVLSLERAGTAVR
jgi:mRNA-degrading endonuclease RelE of RelBE toxin-antitoxin system